MAAGVITMDGYEPHCQYNTVMLLIMVEGLDQGFGIQQGFGN